MSEGKQKMHISTPWLGKPWVDSLFIIAPPFLCLLFIAAFPHLFDNVKEMPVYWWVLLVLLVDVAHVYSTLFRTYFSKLAWKRYRLPMTLIPLASFLFSVMLCSISMALFWTILAYIAVFHFIRQQYGILKLYNRKETNLPQWCKQIDIIVIYTATIYPILHWHFSSPRNFDWFIAGDFLTHDVPWLRTVLTVLYVAIVLAYITKEVILLLRYRIFNLLRVLVILGTLISWYMGIIYFNGDMAFTLLNVVSHGIPYMALVWLFAQKEQAASKVRSSFWKTILKPIGVLLFLLIIFLLAYVEEGLWDSLVWKDNRSVFPLFSGIDTEININDWLRFIVPLLAMPQLTHYIIDGFIWRKQT